MKSHKAARRRKRPVQTPPSRRPQDRLDKILLSLALVGALYLLFGFSYRFVAQHAAFFADHGIQIPTRSAEAQSSQSSERIIYLHTDHAGRPLLGTDASSQVVYTARTEPFGKPQESGNEAVVNLGFPGQYLDKETGLYYNFHRTYNPSIGRYLQPDPYDRFGIAPDPMGKVRALVSGERRVRGEFAEAALNKLYSYADNNPLKFTDPEGLINIKFVNGRVEKKLRKEIDTRAPGLFVQEDRDLVAKRAREEMWFSEMRKLDSDETPEEEKKLLLQGIFVRVKAKLPEDAPQRERDLVQKCQDVFFSKGADKKVAPKTTP